MSLRYIFFLCLCVLLAGTTLSCKGTADKKDRSAEIQTLDDKKGIGNGNVTPLIEEDKARIENFTDFIDRWNNYLDKAGLLEVAYHYELIGDKIASTPLFFDTLDTWFRAFRQNSFDSEQLDRLKEQKLSIIELWDNYRKEHLRNAPFNATGVEDSRSLAKRVNNYVGVLNNGAPIDVVTLDTVRAIVAMNDICVFFYINKNKIHDMNVDKRIRTCDDLKRVYPEFFKNY